jgi:uncharacterized protein (TIGR03790 family)
MNKPPIHILPDIYATSKTFEKVTDSPERSYQSPPKSPTRESGTRDESIMLTAYGGYMRTACLIAIVVLLIPSFARQSVFAATTYDDVAVIVNINSSTSKSIGNYFSAARCIPASNMIYVDAPTAEEIDSTTFESLRSQIETFLQINNLTNSINYLVTTKGVPLKVNRGSTFSTSSPSSSVESELALVLGPYHDQIGKPGRVSSPYYDQSEHFTRARYGIYLVTRLDGYTLCDVLALIDNGGPEVSVNPAALYVLDEDPDWNASMPCLNNYMSMAKSSLSAKGKSLNLNTDTVFVTRKADVVGYMSWGSNDHHADDFTQNAKPYNSWSRGAIAETYVSTSARSFELPVAYGQSLIADLVAEGVSGVKGYVDEPYSGSMAVAFILMDRYSSGYNLAESFHMASAYLSWMDVVIGDPKTSLTLSPEGALPIELQFFRAATIGSSGNVKLVWRTLSERDNYGFRVQRRDPQSQGFVDVTPSLISGHGTTIVPQQYSWADSSAPTGVNSYRLRQIDRDGTEHFSESATITVVRTPGVSDEPRDLNFELGQNYPNPFNPSTTIEYTLRKSGHVSLKVYNDLGQEVASIVDGFEEGGRRLVTFDAAQALVSRLASGAYIYRLEADGRMLSKRMLILK